MLALKLTLAYEGTRYFGWQKTKMGPSIEEELQKALQQILQEPILLTAASRTDRGVHALGQVVTFNISKPIKNFQKLLISLNELLPKDITVRHIEKVEPHFHPTLSVKNKWYQYDVCFGIYQLPQHRLYSWHVHYPLNIETMQEAKKILIGTHDYSSFTNQKKNEHYDNHIRMVHDIEILQREGDRVRFIVSGPHFLYKMVRNIVGSLIYIGMGKLTQEQLHFALHSKDRKKAGITAPAHGLTLLQIFY